MNISDSLDQYADICRDAIKKSSAKLNKSFENLLVEIVAQFKFSVASSRGANQRWCIHDTGRTGCPQCHAAVL